MNVLLLAPLQSRIEAAQLAPFSMFARSLHRTLGVRCRSECAGTFREFESILAEDECDAAFLLPKWSESVQHGVETLQRIRERRPERRLVLIDPFAQLSSRYFGLLPYVDIMCKRQILRDKAQYASRFMGGAPFTDYLSRRWNLDIGEWDVSSELPAAYSERLRTGWNLGVSAEFYRMLLRGSRWTSRWRRRKIDVFCRMSLGASEKREWYCEYRNRAVEAISRLGRARTVAVSGGYNAQLVPKRQYDRELRSSRIVVSPFGWGEVCWRDFEAACVGALLVKPSMSHVASDPNIYIEHETYAPVAWDLSDVEAVCEHYLANWNEANRIIENARQVYREYFRNERFVDTVGEVLGSKAWQ